MMREVVRRRYSGSLSSTLPMPDLVLVDGGRGQLSSACAELAALSQRVPAIGLAKRFEHIVVPDSDQPIVLLPSSPVLHLVQRIRDEAHRFAITYHRRLRQGSVTASALDDIPGIGPARKHALLRRFGSVPKLAAASAEDVAAEARLPLVAAAQLLERLRRSRSKGGGNGRTR
jgi:excinuclease ABC subunit C